jgi:hypothetical protein
MVHTELRQAHQPEAILGTSILFVQSVVVIIRVGVAGPA